MQTIIWSSAAAEFAATLAALNTRALARAGLLDEIETGAMHVFLEQLEGAASTDDQRAICRSLRELLPAAPE